MTRKLIAVVGFAALIALAGCGKREDVVATVGREKITMDEYRNALLQKYRSEENIQRRSLEDRQQVLREMAITEAKYQEALARKIDQRPEVKTEIEEVAKRQALDLLYQDKVLGVVVTDARVREFYDRSGEEVRARHILLKTTPVDTSGADTVRVRARIDSIRKAIDGGLDFKAAAAMFSEDVTSAADSGNLEWFGWGRMVEEFQQAAWKGRPGEVVGPVRTAFGYHLILVEEKRKIENRPAFNDAKEQIRRQLREMEGQRMNEVARKYVDDLRARRKLEYNEETLTMFRLRAADPTITKTVPLDPVFSEEEKRLIAARYDNGQVTIAEMLEKLGANAHRVQWDDPQTPRDLVNAIVEPKFLEEETVRLGYINKAMQEPGVVQQKRNTLVRLLEKEEVTDKVTIAESDEATWYQNHLQNYIQPEQRTVREIFLKEDSARAAMVRERALKGENFARLALKYNEKESTRADTGRIGPHEQKRMGLIGNTAFQLEKVGEISDVVRNGRNYSVVQLIDIIPSRTRSFDESRAQVGRELRMARTEEAQKSLEAALLKKYTLKVKEEKLARAYPMLEQSGQARTDTSGKR